MSRQVHCLYIFGKLYVMLNSICDARRQLMLHYLSRFLLREWITIMSLMIFYMRHMWQLGWKYMHYMYFWFEQVELRELIWSMWLLWYIRLEHWNLDGMRADQIIKWYSNWWHISRNWWPDIESGLNWSWVNKRHYRPGWNGDVGWYRIDIGIKSNLNRWCEHLSK